MGKTSNPPVIVDGVVRLEVEDDGLLTVGWQSAAHILKLEHTLITVNQKLKIATSIVNF